MLDYIYITRARALESQLTHEGTLFGVPAYFSQGEDDNEVSATTKMPILNLWCVLCDSVLELIAHFAGPEVRIITPMTITKALRP